MKRKVAIYARVSTEHEAQLSALDNQVQYYDNRLEQHPDWELYDRYIDEGITGTNTKKREQFTNNPSNRKLHLINTQAFCKWKKQLGRWAHYLIL